MAEQPYARRILPAVLGGAFIWGVLVAVWAALALW